MEDCTNLAEEAWARGFRQASREDARASGTPATTALVPPNRANLARLIEGEIIPRLMLAYEETHVAADAKSVEQAGANAPTIAHVAEFTRLLLKGDDRAWREAVDALRGDGASLDQIFLELFAPSARLLGEMWERDLCSFSDVTVGLCRLQQLLRRYAPGFTGEISRPGSERRALIMPLPEEQHIFGVLMVEEFFRRDGWIVQGGPMPTSADLAEIVSRDWFSLVGLSVSCDSFYSATAESIRLIRSSSANPRIAIMVGGRAFNERPEGVVIVGADFTAIDGRQAVELAASLVPREGWHARPC